jgi:hypothetical protein
MGRARGEPSPASPRGRNLLGCLAVLVVLGAIGLGLPALNRAVPAARPIAEGRPYEIGAGVTVLPPPGAALDVTRSRPGTDRGTALFLLGGVRYALTALPFDGDLSTAVAALRHEITALHGYQVTGVEVPARTSAGVAGRQGGYTSPGRVGQYSVFLYRGIAVQVTIAGADPDLRAALPAMQASVASIRFPAAR